MEFLINLLLNHFVIWSLIGIIVGLGTRMLDDQQVKGGPLVAVILGIVGANIVGFTVNMILGPFNALDLFSLISGLIGAIAFVTIQRFVLKDSLGSIPEREMSSQPTSVE